jgi:predicted amidohydrolase YtcJ
MNPSRFLFLLALLLFGGVFERAYAGAPGTLFYGGHILTNDGRGTVVDALLAVDGRVIAVGTLAQLETRPQAREAARVDLKGASVVPGLQDAHGSLEAFGSALEDVDLTGTKSYEEVIARVRTRAATLKPGTWILGRGWDQNQWAMAAMPHHFMLSNAVPDHPVLLAHADGHAALVNEAALAVAKLDGLLDPEPKIQGGRVLLDETKHATGVLYDAAVELVSRAIPESDLETRTRRFLSVQEKLLALGLTAVHDMGTSRSMLGLLLSLRSKGKLALRVVCYVDGQGEMKKDSFSGLPLPPDERDILCVAGVRLQADGALGSRGAALIDDYSDAPKERGLLLFTEEELNTRIAAIARAGLQPAVHAVGDRANRMVLDAYERVGIAVPGLRDLRPRVEHAQVVSPKDWPRFPQLGVVPSMQPSSAISDMPWVQARLGAERTRGAYAWRALAPQLGRLAFGSDFPLENPDPLRGLYAARTRQSLAVQNPSDQVAFVPEQRLDGNAALVGFTSGAAYACHQEDRRGRLVPGFACDMTVLDVDPTTCEPSALLKARILMTVVNGRVVWRPH